MTRPTTPDARPTLSGRAGTAPPAELEKLLDLLDVKLDAFAICEIEDGCALRCEPLDLVVVHFVLQGRGEIEWADGAFAIEPGAMIVVPRHLPKQINGAGPVRRVVDADNACRLESGLVAFRAAEGAADLILGCGSLEANLGDGPGLLESLPAPIHVQVKDEVLPLLFRAMLAELSTVGIGTRAIVSALMKQIMVLLLRSHLESAGERSPLHVALMDPRLNAGAPLSKVGLDPSASAQLFYNHDDDSLRIVVNGTGFEAGIPHVAHIHGNLVNPMTSGSGALDSMTPTLAQDVDGDGFIELFEGLTTYGPILFDLMNIDANQDGTIDYDMTFDLKDPGAPFGFIDPLDPSKGRYGITDLVGLDFESLDLREMVIHGLTVPPGVGIDNPNQEPPTDDEINGVNTFAPPPGQPPFGHTIVFPVASGELVAGIPEPATWALMIGGFGLVGGALRSRRQKAAMA